MSERVLAVLASGQGTNFEALAQAERRGTLGGRIAVLVSDRQDAPALERARRLGIEALALDPGRTRARVEDEAAWIEALRSRGVEVVLLAGFMRLLGAAFLAAFPGRILNIHPPLLPPSPGLAAVGRPLEHGGRWTGCTVPLVDQGTDSGPILAQAALPILDDDTLASLTARVHEAEHRLYPEAVTRFLTQ